MTDYTELKRLAEAFPADLDWDSNSEPFFNGPSGESLGGGPTGFYCVYGPAFEIDDEQYDGPTYVESCKVDFAKFMVAAAQALRDEWRNDQSDAERYRYLRDRCGLVEYKAFAGSIGPGMLPSGEALDAAIDAAMGKGDRS